MRLISVITSLAAALPNGSTDADDFPKCLDESLALGPLDNRCRIRDVLATSMVALGTQQRRREEAVQIARPNLSDNRCIFLAVMCAALLLLAACSIVHQRIRSSS